MLHLDCNTRDVAAKLFEAFREAIREHIRLNPSNNALEANKVYEAVHVVVHDGSEVYLYNCLDTFMFIEPIFYTELIKELLHYIEGEIEA